MEGCLRSILEVAGGMIRRILVLVKLEARQMAESYIER